MLTSILVIAAIGGSIYGLKRWRSLPQDEQAAFSKKAILYAVAAIVLGLVVAGRAHWLMGLLAALLALAGRVAQFAQYMPLFKKFMGDESAATGADSIVNADQGMSKQDAADILGVDVSAKPDDIRMAHKRLMQKIHPDRGGSDALAKQINQAKDVLFS